MNTAVGGTLFNEYTTIENKKAVIPERRSQAVENSGDITINRDESYNIFIPGKNESSVSNNIGILNSPFGPGPVSN